MKTKLAGFVKSEGTEELRKVIQDQVLELYKQIPEPPPGYHVIVFDTVLSYGQHLEDNKLRVELFYKFIPNGQTDEVQKGNYRSASTTGTNGE